jgi:uncharacterized Zn finger protein
MKPGWFGLAPCAVCRQDVPHQVIHSVQRGRVFLMCLGCGTVSNIPKPEEKRP